jgi:hypothetical protein
MLSLLVNVLVFLTAGSSVFLRITLVVHSGLDRPHVQSLTSGVSGSCQKSYATYSEAFTIYQELKAKGLVRIIRDPGDEIFFGHTEDAMQ